MARDDDRPVTPQDILALMAPGAPALDRGPRLSAVTAEDVEAICDSGDMPVPRPGQYSRSVLDLVCAQLNSRQPEDLPEDRHQAVVDALEEAREQRDRTIAQAHADFQEAVRAALETTTPRDMLADAAGVNRTRLYQLRDGTR